LIQLTELKIIGYECLNCSSPKKGMIIVTDYKEHLRDKHKIKEAYIPAELIGSPWEEDFVILYDTKEACSTCHQRLQLRRFPNSHEFLEKQCISKGKKGEWVYHHQLQNRVFFGSAKKKYFCERHGYNSNTEPCFFCDMEGTLGKLIGGRK